MYSLRSAIKIIGCKYTSFLYNSKIKFKRLPIFGQPLALQEIKDLIYTVRIDPFWYRLDKKMGFPDFYKAIGGYET